MCVCSSTMCVCSSTVYVCMCVRVSCVGAKKVPGTAFMSSVEPLIPVHFTFHMDETMPAWSMAYRTYTRQILRNFAPVSYDVICPKHAYDVIGLGLLGHMLSISFLRIVLFAYVLSCH
jgi:hypothetical protein